MRIACLLLLLLCSAFYSGAQNVPGYVWKNKVSRKVDTRAMHTAANDTALITLLIGAIKAEKVAVYAPWDGAVRMTVDNAIAQFYGYKDTVNTSIYQIMNKDSLAVPPHQKPIYQPDSFYKYRMYEEWSFYPGEGIMNVQIKYLAPIQRVYADDGVFRGEAAKCWLPYDELITVAYNKKDRAAWLPLFSNTWKSYFSSDSGTKDVTSPTPLTWHATAIRVIDMEEVEDTVKHLLRNENGDTLLSEHIVTAIKNNKIPAWTALDKPFGKLLTTAQLTALTTDEADRDTLITEDVKTQNELIRIVTRDFNYHNVHKYKILEDWTFDAATGKTTIAIKGVAPMKDIFNYDGVLTRTKTMFWIRYNDLQKILEQQEQYHPTHTFAMHLWDNYFITDTLPAYGDH